VVVTHILRAALGYSFNTYSRLYIYIYMRTLIKVVAMYPLTFCKYHINFFLFLEEYFFVFCFYSTQSLNTHNQRFLVKIHVFQSRMRSVYSPVTTNTFFLFKPLKHQRNTRYESTFSVPINTGSTTRYFNFSIFWFSPTLFWRTFDTFDTFYYPLKCEGVY